MPTSRARPTTSFRPPVDCLELADPSMSCILACTVEEINKMQEVSDTE